MSGGGGDDDDGSYSDSPFGADAWVVSAGFALTLALIAPLSFLNLDDNIAVQKGSFVLLVAICLEWMVACVLTASQRGGDDDGNGTGGASGGGDLDDELSTDGLSAFGTNFGSALGSVLFNFAFVLTVPRSALRRRCRDARLAHHGLASPPPTRRYRRGRRGGLGPGGFGEARSLVSAALAASRVPVVSSPRSPLHTPWFLLRTRARATPPTTRLARRHNGGSWLNEKRPDVRAAPALWGSVALSVALFVALGWAAATAYPTACGRGEDLTSVLTASSSDDDDAGGGVVGSARLAAVTQVAAYLFPLAALWSGVPVLSIIVRYNLEVRWDDRREERGVLAGRGSIWRGRAARAGTSRSGRRGNISKGRAAKAGTWRRRDHGSIWGGRAARAGASRSGRRPQSRARIVSLTRGED